MKSAQVILFSILAACGYGIVHDQITVRVCPEYFTVAHPPLFHTTSLTLLALCWGVAATAGIGAALGVLLARVSQSGEAAPYPVGRIGRSILVLLAVMGGSAFLAAILGYGLSQRGVLSLPVALTARIPAPLHDRFMAVWFAHGASYLVGLGGGALLCFLVWRARGRPRVFLFFPRTWPGVLRAVVLLMVVVYLLWSRWHPA